MAEQKNTCVTGIAQISTANSNLDGTGTLVKVITADATYGTLLTSVTVKSIETTSAGMVRLFVKQSDTYYLLEEFEIPSVTPSGQVQSYGATLVFPYGGFKLAPSSELYATTENAETFNVIAEGYIWTYA